MSVKTYKSSTARRIFSNHPFKKGMLYEEVTLVDSTSKTIVNLDIPSSGDYAYPRPAYVNAAIDTFFEVALDFPTTIIKQSTSLAKSFLIGFEQTVSEEDFVNDVVDTTQSLNRPETLGLYIISNGNEFEEKERRNGIFKIVGIDDVFDGDTFRFKILRNGQEEQVTVRLLGIDTPELWPTPEPFADAAREFASIILNPLSNTVGDYTILNRYIQYEPATVSTDHIDSQRVLAYVVIHLKNSIGQEYYYTLSEMLLKAGLGIMLVGKNYMYHGRHKAAYDHAIKEKLGIHPLEEAEEVAPPVPDWPLISTPTITLVSNGIAYDPLLTEYFVEFTITNTSVFHVNLFVELASWDTTVYLQPSGTFTARRKIFMDFPYVLRARLFPFNLQDQLSPSKWAEQDLGMVTLNLTSGNVPPLNLSPLTQGVGYTMTNNLLYPLFVRLRYFKTPVNPILLEEGFLQPTGVLSGGYTDFDWPLFETYTKNIEVFYQTPINLGTVRSLTLNVSQVITGYMPVVSHVSTNGKTIKVSVENKNTFATAYMLLVDGKDEGILTNIAANTTVQREVQLPLYSTVYNFQAYFSSGGQTSQTTATLNITSGAAVPQAYEVRFLDWNGTVLTTQFVNPGNFATLPPTEPTRVGYDFQNWNPNPITTAINRATDFTAVYQIKTYTVTFRGFNLEVLKTETVNHGANATAPAIPAVTNYAFSTWSRSFTNVTENITVDAHYNQVKLFTPSATLSLSGSELNAHVTDNNSSGLGVLGIDFEIRLQSNNSLVSSSSNNIQADAQSTLFERIASISPSTNYIFRCRVTHPTNQFTSSDWYSITFDRSILVTANPTVDIFISSSAGSTNHLNVLITNMEGNQVTATVTGTHGFTDIPTSFNANQTITRSREVIGFAGSTVTYTISVTMQASGKGASETITKSVSHTFV